MNRNVLVFICPRSGNNEGYAQDRGNIAINAMHTGYISIINNFYNQRPRRRPIKMYVVENPPVTSFLPSRDDQELACAKTLLAEQIEIANTSVCSTLSHLSILIESLLLGL